MEETDLHNPLLLESQKDAVVEHAPQEEADKQHRTFQPMFLESQEDIFVDEASIEKSKQCGAPIGKVPFGLIALVLAIAAVIAFCNNGSQPLSDIDLLATVVMPGVDTISNLNETAPQYRALEWLAYNDTRGLTIDDNATELLERFSLVTFYYSVGGDSLRKSEYLDWSGWLKNSSHCDWDNFNCDEDGRVTSLDFMIGGLRGTLPTEIGNLKRLTFLGVTGNFWLVGPIPSEIGHLQQLERLDLEDNELSGPIPSEIGHLQQLKHLDLSHNKISGPIPSEVGHLQQLERLYLQDNIGLTGTVPVEVGQLESIWEALFCSTSLTGGLDNLAFCKNEDFLFSLMADCGGLNPKITCECCTLCCRT
eukprot:scaffold7428_cov63-Cylindrotheca_fusiformis.AAC.2